MADYSGGNTGAMGSEAGAGVAVCHSVCARSAPAPSHRHRPHSGRSRDVYVSMGVCVGAGGWDRASVGITKFSWECGARACMCACGHV